MQAEVSSNARLAKAVKVMGSGTLISRVLGLVRLMLIAALLGTSTPRADIFWAANLIPNSLLLLLAGGVLNTVLVPQITRAIHADEDGGEAYVNRILTAFGLAIAGLTVILTAAAPLVTALYTSNKWRAPELAQHYAGMVALAYLCVPQLFFYGMFFLLGQVLNAKDEFGPMNWAPIANNVVSIGVLGVYFAVWGSGNASEPFTTGQIWVLGLGSTIGIIVQLLVLLPYMKRTGYTFRMRFDLKGTGLGRTARIAKWTIYYVVVSQLTLILITRLATSATAGTTNGAGATVYSSAEMLWLLPHSLITVSLATAMLSSASRLAAAGNLDGVAQETTKTIRFAVVLLVPASVGLVALAAPAARLLFGHGAGASGAGFIATTLIAFAIGLVPYTVQFICTRTYYALEDTRTAFLLQFVVLSLNAGLAVAFVAWAGSPSLVAPALALAVTVAYCVGVVITLRALRRRLPSLSTVEITQFTARLFAAAVPAGLACFVVVRVMTSQVSGFLGDLLASGLGVLAFLPVYLGLSRLLGITELDAAVARLLGRSKGAVVTPPAEAVPPAPDEIVLPDVTDELIDTVPRPAIIVEPDATMAPIVESGQMLSHRYSLQDRLLRRGDTETWLAFDNVLSRLVLIHLLPTDSPRLKQVLDAARKGAVATESRFLRVLDAVEARETGLPIGGYVVCEFAPGQTLEELLTHGPLSAIEAAWIVRELADALSIMHAQGLFHERLNPDTVLVSASGNVKIVGFGVESVLTPPTEGDVSWSRREAADVRALGKLLYATLVARWPGGDAWGMRAAPRDPQGDFLTPRQVRAGVAPALDAICDQILSSTPRRGEAPLRTASDIVHALNKVLGTADASSDLEQRLRYPTVATKDSAPMPPLPADATQPLRVVMVETDEADFPPEPLTIRPPAAVAGANRARPRRRWLVGLIGIVVTTLFVSLAAMAFKDAAKGTLPPTPGVSGSPGASSSGKPLAIASGRDFDPPPGDNAENPSQVPLAFDGKPETAWTTERYRRSANFNGAKPGVGIILDLGSAQSVSAVNVTLTGTPTSLEIRVPAGSSPGAALTDWTPVASAQDAGTDVTLTPTSPVQTRYVLLWLTSMPKASDGRFVGTVNEVQVLG